MLSKKNVSYIEGRKGTFWETLALGLDPQVPLHQFHHHLDGHCRVISLRFGGLGSWAWRGELLAWWLWALEWRGGSCAVRMFLFHCGLFEGRPSEQVNELAPTVSTLGRFQPNDQKGIANVPWQSTCLREKPRADACEPPPPAYGEFSPQRMLSCGLCYNAQHYTSIEFQDSSAL